MADEYEKETHYHGGHGGYQQKLILQEGEYITSMSGELGIFKYQDHFTLCKLKISTNLGRSISGGNGRDCKDMQSFSYSAKEEEQIFALTGMYSTYMRDISVGMYTRKDEKPISADAVSADKGAEWDSDILEEAAVGQGLQGGSLTEAIQGGAFLRKAIEDMVKHTLELKDIDPLNEKGIEDNRSSIEYSLLSKKYVNKAQFVFRGQTIGGEQQYIIDNRKILSKAVKNKKVLKSVIQMDTQNTKQYEYATVLRILATKNSSYSPSQFVSHALDYQTASRYAASKYVFAYKIIPSSPLMGIDDSAIIGEGEEQYQILGGTPITELYRCPAVGDGKRWEKYNFSAKVWENTSKHPINLEYEQLRGKKIKQDKDEEEEREWRLN